MTTILFEDVFSDNSVNEALKQLDEKKDSCGADGVYLSGLRSFLEINRNIIFQQIKNGTYKPGVVKTFDIVNKNGKVRRVAQYNSIDKLILKCVNEKLKELIEPTISPNCFSFKNNSSTTNAVKKACEYLNRVDIVLL